MPLSSGDVFAGYKIKHLLGAGGMGEVYLAQHPRLPRLDALKILPSSMTSDTEFRERFIREADLAASLWHPHIVGVHDRGEFGGQLWLAMDYVDGPDTARLLRERFPTGMPAHHVADIVAAIADALDYAHERDLLHRDVKPANILLTDDKSGRRRILLADFGVARRTDDISGLTATNMTVGSVAYAAPEQLMGEPIDGRADQYALAATTFHLLTGNAPFQHSNPAVVISQHLNAPPPTLAHERPELAYLDPALTTALTKNPNDRFARCSDFAARLHRQKEVVAPEQVTEASITQRAAIPAAEELATPAKHRFRAVDLIPAALALLLIAAAVFAMSQHLRREPAPIRTQAEWQPYVDAGSQFVTDMYTFTPQSVDDAVDRVLAGSTGGLHDQLAAKSGDLRQLFLETNGSSSATIDGAGLESLDGTKAEVLVAARRTMSVDGVPSPSTPIRLRLTVVKSDGSYKVADMSHPAGDS